MRARIAVTGAGGAAGIGVLRAVESLGCEVHAIDASALAAGLYMVPANRRAVVPMGDAPGFVDAVLDLCRQRRIEVLVPTVDAELTPLAAARTRFEREGVTVVVEPLEVLGRCLDKWALHASLTGTVALPETAVVDVDFADRGWRYPFVVKPRRGSGGRGVVIVERAADMAGMPLDGRLIAQELLPGAEYSVDVLGDGTGRALAAVPRERLLVDSGIAVAARTLRSAELVDFGRDVAERLGCRHVVNVQVRRDRSGRPCLLEVNPRVPGTIAITGAAGVNMPLHVVERALGRTPAAVDGSFEEVAMVRALADIVIPRRQMDALNAQAAGMAEAA